MAIALTINGIDGFKSGKWNLHPNAKVIDDETLELNATGSYNNSDMVMPCLPNTTYTFAHTGNGQTQVTGLDSVGGVITPTLKYLTEGEVKTFTTQSSCVKLRVFMSNGTLPNGKYTFKRPMLNLGTIPAPYEKKRGERMVMPQVKGQLNPKPMQKKEAKENRKLVRQLQSYR